MAKTITEQLKELQQLFSALPSYEQRDKKPQFERLRDQFLPLLTKFQDQQRDMIQREKNSIARARTNSGLNPVSLLKVYYCLENY